MSEDCLSGVSELKTLGPPRLPVELMRRIVEEAVFRHDGISEDEQRAKILRIYFQLHISTRQQHEAVHAVCDVAGCHMPMNLLLTGHMLHEFTKEAFMNQAHMNLKTRICYERDAYKLDVWDMERSVAFLERVRFATISLYAKNHKRHFSSEGKYFAAAMLRHLSKWLSGSTCLQINMLSSLVDASAPTMYFFRPDEVDAALEKLNRKCIVRVVLMSKHTKQCEGGLGRPEQLEITDGSCVAPQSSYFQNHNKLDASFQKQHNEVFEIFRAKALGRMGVSRLGTC